MDELPFYYSIDAECRVDLREKGSRFVAYLFPVWEDGVFEHRLSDLRKEFYDATHHCSAVIRYATPLAEHAHDDGEPSGTAGLPILNAMRSARLVNAGLIVIRYFGGTKLGKSGLIETYGEAARQCIQSSNLRKVEAAATLRVRSSYENMKTVDLLLSRMAVDRLSSEYLESVAITIRIKADDIARFRNNFDQVEYTGIKYELEQAGLVFARTD